MDLLPALSTGSRVRVNIKEKPPFLN